ncbi:hypothetical protein KW785_00450 [Candidatus Parcubacteria bacterium]|nr:hypothetical protein [Candidatus Parcubacteria bacterium]
MDATLLPELQNLLSKHGFTLDEEQPHISGERFLMQKQKLVLMGRRIKDGLRVAIKISNMPEGKRGISEEKHARDLLQSITFANGSILFPQEIYWKEDQGYLMWAIEFIEQDKVFVAHTLEEQFFIALKAFEAQEAFHATTYEHIGTVKKVFPILYAQEYFREFAAAKEVVGNTILDEAETLLHNHKQLIDKYCNYLTHTDFVPHNFRIRDNRLYMLDCAPEVRTMHFGNKYEGWARFLNYMVIHNPGLDRAISEYIKKNRGAEDYLNLRLMRIYKISFLMRFYKESLAETEGDLHQLTKERLAFWQHILRHILDDTAIPLHLIQEYKGKRDTLRSDEEKKRQKEFAVA